MKPIKETINKRLPLDETERNRWLAAIPRDNILETDETAACERHWPENYSKVFVFGKPRPANPLLVSLKVKFLLNQIC